MSRYSGEGGEGPDILRLFRFYPTPYSGRTRAEGSGPPFYLLNLSYPNSFPRQKRNKIEDTYDKDEFDNGYSTKISEITSNDADNSQPNSQLMEKTSIRSGKLLDSIWFKHHGNSRSEEEEEIRNVFRDENEEEDDLEVDGEISNQATLCPCKSRNCVINSLLLRYQMPNESISQTNRKKEIKSNAIEQKLDSSSKHHEQTSSTHSLESIKIHKNQPTSTNICARERTSDISLTETDRQLKDENPKNDQINEPDPNRDLTNDSRTQLFHEVTEKEKVEEDAKYITESNSTPSTTDGPTSEENHIKDESDDAKEDFDDEIDDKLLEEDEFDEYYGDYTFDDILPGNIPESVKKVFGAGGVPGKEGRYSKGISQYANMPTFMESIRKFASDNRFELEDVIPDGNCMFRAVVDQLNINGDLGYTPQTLRLKAVRYLRQNPCQSDGSKLEAFLLTETWEQYLLRMEQNSQWGDHMILKAIADAFNLIVVVFNVFEDDIRRTEILPEGIPITKRQRLTIYLGHIGEFHYLSLRQFDWEIFWPFKSLTRRLQAAVNLPKASSTKTVFREKIAKMGISKHLKGAGLMTHSTAAENTEQTSSSVVANVQEIDLQSEQNKTFVRYGLATLQMEETEESLHSHLEDPMGIDPLTGLPLPHFSYVIKRLTDLELMTINVFHEEQLFPKEYKAGNVWVTCEMHGPSAEGVNVCMNDQTKERKMQYFEEVKRFNTASTLICNMTVEVIFPGDSNKDTSKMVLFADSTNTHIGYCRLIPGFPTSSSWKHVLFREHSKDYIKTKPIPSELKNVFPGIDTKKLAYGYRSSFFPSAARNWQSRQRRNQWPSVAIIQEIISGGCLLIQRAHPKSNLPHVEWEFLFSNAEQILIKKAFSTNQLKVFKMYKVVVEYLTRHLEKTLKHKHLINVFFNASENIALESWEKNIGGCLLFVFGYLLDCLKKRNIPHYFIPENNLIDCYSEKEIQTISVYIEAFRVLPVQCLENIYSRHGWKYVLKTSQRVLKDSKHFSETRDISHAWLNVFHPTSIKVATAVADMGLFEAAYEMICEVYDDLKRSPLPEKPSFETVFQDAMKYVKAATNREALVKLHDEKCGRNVTNNNQKSRNRQPMYISDIMPFTVDERIRDLKIPETHCKSQFLIITWLDSKAREYFKGLKFEMAEVLLQADIKYIKLLIKEQNEFDISEIEDKNLRSEIGRQRTERTTNLISRLFTEYDHLFCICVGLGNTRPFDEHMADLEEIQHSVEGAGELLAKVRAFPNGSHPPFYFPGFGESSMRSPFFM